MLLTVRATGLEVAGLPDASVATAVRVWDPLAAVIEFQARVYGAAVRRGPMLIPSSWNWTPATATLSPAIAARLTTPATTEPGAGPVMLTVGGWVSAVEVPAAWFDGVPSLPAPS